MLSMGRPLGRACPSPSLLASGFPRHSSASRSSHEGCPTGGASWLSWRSCAAPLPSRRGGFPIAAVAIVARPLMSCRASSRRLPRCNFVAYIDLIIDRLLQPQAVCIRYWRCLPTSCGRIFDSWLYLFHQLSNSEYQPSWLVFLMPSVEVHMPCFKPLKAYTSSTFNRETGNYGITFSPTKALIEGSSFKLPCGQCHGCRFDRAQQWAIRCGNEAQMHAHNCFLTLTYNDASLPADYSVKKRDFQLMMMRTQKALGRGKRYFGVGEYGDDDGRPHYHLLGFGFDFSEDRKPHAKRDGHQVWRSAKLEELWPFGFSEIGSVTPQSAGYVARYCMKKLTGDLARDHYLRPSPVDGQLHQVEPEFGLMSRRPGIGSTWFDRFKSDAFPSDFMVVDGRKKPVPRYYVSKLNEVEAKALDRQRLRKEFRDLPARRRRRANETPERLAVREEVTVSKHKRLVRTLRK